MLLTWTEISQGINLNDPRVAPNGASSSGLVIAANALQPSVQYTFQIAAQFVSAGPSALAGMRTFDAVVVPLIASLFIHFMFRY